MFDFNEVCTLYRTQKIDDARIMLYENINVLTTKCGFVIPEDELSDKLGDIFLLVDKRINQALNKGYQNKEVYIFIKTKIRWTLVNDRNRKSKVEFNDELMNIMEQFPSKQETDMKGELEYEYILNYIGDMDEPYRTVMLLNLVVDEGYNLQEISKDIGKTLYETSEIYKEGIRMIRQFLLNKHSTGSDE